MVLLLARPQQLLVLLACCKCIVTLCCSCVLAHSCVGWHLLLCVLLLLAAMLRLLQTGAALLDMLLLQADISLRAIVLVVLLPLLMQH
jgi:hypothetical protein